MAKLYISEYAGPLRQADGWNKRTRGLQIAEEPCLLDQGPVTFSAAAQSAAFGAQTSFIRVWSDADCCIKIGTNPTATTSNKPLAAKSPEYFGVKPGDKISVIAL